MTHVIVIYICMIAVSLCIACISIGFFVNSPVPVYFEIAVEGMFPVSEGNVNMVMAFLNNAVSLVFLMLLLIPNIGESYKLVNWSIDNWSINLLINLSMFIDQSVDQ